MIKRSLRRILLAALALLAMGARDAVSEPHDPRDLVVMITVKTKDSDSQFGAGIIVKQTRSPRQILIVTAKHVVATEGTAVMQVEFKKLRGKTFRAQPTKYADDTLDLAVLTVEGPDLPEVLSPGLAASVSTIPAEALAGRQVTYVGHTKGIPWEQSLTPDKVADASATELKVASRYVAEGTSGGAMFDAESGALVGMVKEIDRGMAVALPIQLVLGRLRRWDITADLRSDSQSERIAAQRQLVDRGYPMTAAGLAQALTAADKSNLALFAKAELPSAVIAEALRTRREDRTVAQRYFEATRSANVGVGWLEEALSRKGDRLDPDLRVPHKDVEEEAIINTAARAANAPAVLALLKAGASPHGYQRIRNWALQDPRFVLPFGPIWNESKLDAREKSDLFRAMLDAGAVVVRIPPVATAGGVLYGPVAHETKILSEAIQKVTGLPLRPTPDLCERFPKRECERDRAHTGVKWCEIVSAVPKVVGRLDAGAREEERVPAFIPRYYLGADARTGYFLAELLDFASGYALLEVDKDLQHMRLLRYTNLRWVGAGACIGGDPRLGFCWTEIALTRDARTGNYTHDLELAPPLPVSFACADAGAQVRARAASVVPRPFQHANPQVAACVNDIIQVPTEQLMEEASRFNLFAQKKLTLDAKGCVLANMNMRLLSGDKRPGQLSYVRAQAQSCCEKTLGTKPPGTKPRPGTRY